MLREFANCPPDLVSVVRVTIAFGAEALASQLGATLERYYVANRAAARNAEELANLHAKISLYYSTNKKAASHYLELQRASTYEAHWKVSYPRAIDRDRLQDWLKWQKNSFAAYLVFVDEHGPDALTRKLTDEMFATERRIKKEGRSAGGSRPLRMWRGD